MAQRAGTLEGRLGPARTHEHFVGNKTLAQTQFRNTKTHKRTLCVHVCVCESLPMSMPDCLCVLVRVRTSVEVQECT